MDILSMLTHQLSDPKALGALGNQKKEQGGSDVMGLIGNVLGGFFNK